MSTRSAEGFAEFGQSVPHQERSAVVEAEARDESFLRHSTLSSKHASGLTLHYLSIGDWDHDLSFLSG